MKVVFIFFLLACWFASCYTDTLIADSASYGPNDPITITFTTTNQYATINLTIANALLCTVTDPSGNLTGTYYFRNYVTCELGALSGANLTITVTGIPLSRPPVDTTINPKPTFTNNLSICAVYFTTPATNPAQINAARNFSVSVFSSLTLTNAYVTLNGKFFCSLGAVTATSTVSCTGLVPRFLPSCAQFAIVDQQTRRAFVTYPGPIIQLTPSTDCTPSFAAVPESAIDCPNPFAPLNTIDFIFSIDTNDNAAKYSNFEIWASNPAFLLSVLIARVEGPLRAMLGEDFTYLIKEFVIPCSMNGVGATVFTLSYIQTLDNDEQIRKVISTTVVIDSNIECNLTLVMDSPGTCPLLHNSSDCGCPSRESGLFVLGDRLSFYICNGSIPIVVSSSDEPHSIMYYSNADTFLVAVSSANFYAANQKVPGLGYKPIRNRTNNLISIPTDDAGMPLAAIAGYTTKVAEDLWALDDFQTVYCGTLAGLTAATLTLPVTGTILQIAVGPTGVWLVSDSGTWYNKVTTACNDATPWTIVTGISGVPDAISSAATGVYILNFPQIQFITSPQNTPFNVSTGGPSSPYLISASNMDDSLAVLDATTNNVWLLSSPTGTWTQTTLISLTLVNYNFTNLYTETSDAPNIVSRIVFGPISIFDAIPTYSALSLTIESVLPPLTLYSSDSPPPFDTCNNALVASWTIPFDYRGVELVIAALNYTAEFPNGLVRQLTSSIYFSIGPHWTSELQSTSGCPVPYGMPTKVLFERNPASSNHQ